MPCIRLERKKWKEESHDDNASTNTQYPIRNIALGLSCHYGSGGASLFFAQSLAASASATPTAVAPDSALRLHCTAGWHWQWLCSGCHGNSAVLYPLQYFIPSSVTVMSETEFCTTHTHTPSNIKQLRCKEWRMDESAAGTVCTKCLISSRKRSLEDADNIMRT